MYFQPGDILLLRGMSSTTKPNLLSQSIIRLKSAKYSHVAVAYSKHSIADATPEHGVQIRVWSDIYDDYDLSKSIILRPLVPLDEVAFRAKVHFYLSQPYKLISLSSKKRVKRDAGGVVCSQFATIVFGDLGIDISSRPIQYSLPIDIYTRLSGDGAWVKEPFPSRNCFHEAEFLSENLDEFADRMAIQVLKAELQTSRLQYSLTDTLRVISEISKSITKNRRTSDIDNQIFDLSIDSEEGSAGEDGDQFLDLWVDYFLSNVEEDRNEVAPRFLHESEREHGPKSTFLHSISVIKNRRAREIIPDAEKVIDELLKKLNYWLGQVANYSLTESQILEINVQVKLVAKHVRKQVQLIDKLLPPSDPNIDHRISECYRFIEAIKSNPTEHSKFALDCLEGQFMLDQRHSFWIGTRTNYLNLCDAAERIDGDL